MNGAKNIRSYGYKVGSIPCKLDYRCAGSEGRALYGGRKWS